MLLFINLFSDVKVEYLTMSLTEYKNFSLNCGTVYDILVNRVEYTDKALRMNQAVCFNNAVLRVLILFLEQFLYYCRYGSELGM